MKCKTCGHEEKEYQPTKLFRIGNVEFETETHDFDKCLKDIEIPKGWRLWTYREAIENHNNHKKELNLKDCWIFIEQPFKENKENGYVAGLYTVSSWAYLYCFWDPSVHVGSLGVRFCREVKR